jgi:hypothetical protein
MYKVYVMLNSHKYFNNKMCPLWHVSFSCVFCFFKGNAKIPSNMIGMTCYKSINILHFCYFFILYSALQSVSFKRRRPFYREFSYGLESLRNENLLNAALNYNGIHFMSLLFLLNLTLGTLKTSSKMQS